MSHPPPTPDPIPAALTHLFAEGDHFLRREELLDAGMEEPAVDAIAAAVAEHATAQAQAQAEVHAQVQAHAQAQAQAQVQAEVHTDELAMHEQTLNMHDAPLHLEPHPHSQRSHSEQEDERKHDLSALEVLSHSLRSENDRLRRAISTLEGEIGGLDPSSVHIQPMPDSLPIDSALGVDDLSGITQHTLRELASAAVEDAGFTFPGLESLQHLDDSHEQEEHHHAPQHEAGAEENAATIGDFLHGLVAQVTVPRAGFGDVQSTRVDPFEVTRRALEVEIASTRAAIAAKEAEIAAAKANVGVEANGEGSNANGASAAESASATPGGASPAPQAQDKATLDAQLAKATTALESAKSRAAVLRDAVLRVKRDKDATTLNVLGMEAELAVLGDGDVDGGERAQSAVRALRDVRGYVEEVLKAYKEGKLSAPPLPSLPPMMLASMAPPSSLPKKRGRPPRSAAKPSVVPAQLAHLVPDDAEVAAKAEHAPIRRKGIKRNKVELEREQARITEETEMMKSLARMGVWKGEEVGWVEE